MLDHYKKLTKRMTGREAIIRTARKLLRTIRAVMLSEKMHVRGVAGGLITGEINAPSLPPPIKKRRAKATSTIGI